MLPDAKDGSGALVALRGFTEITRDMTERKKIEEELRESEGRFRAVFEESPVGIILANPIGEFIKSNSSLRRFLGCDAAQIEGKTFKDVLFPEDWSSSALFFRELETGNCLLHTLESRYVRSDGKIVWGALNCAIILDDNNKPVYILGMINDITERKNIEQELRASETRFRTVFREAPIGIVITDSEGRYADLNPTFQRMVGYSRQELIGKTFGELTHPDDGPQDLALYREMIAGKRVQYQMEKRYVRKDGRLVWGNLNASLMKSMRDGRHSIKMIEDITQRKLAEQQVQMLAHTITSMNECVAITDLEYKVLSVNPAFLSTYGYREEEILERDLTEVWADIEQLKQITEATIEGGWNGVVTNFRKNGEQFPVALSTSVLRDERGIAVALASIMRDITEERKLQQQLEEAKRQREADLRRFAVSVQQAQEEERRRISRELHDDLCQRLSGMKLNVEVLEDDVQKVDKVSYDRMVGFKKQLESMITEVRRMSSNLRPTVLDDFGLVIALNLLAREQMRTTGVETKFRQSGNRKSVAPHMETAIFRIAQEALSNIAKHSGASAATLTLDYCTEDVTLTIEDDGKGFNDTDLRNARESGGGLGLISMRERTELLGGTLNVEATANKGTTIKISLPLEVQGSYEKSKNTHCG